MRFYTYLYRDIDGTPIYAGKGTKKRAWAHFKAEGHLGNLLRKRLRDGFKLEPEFLCKDVDEEFAFFVEEEMIRKYGRKNLGTGTLLNRTDGGEGSSRAIVSKETRDKRSKSNTGKVRSAESKENYRLANLGHKNPAFGKPAHNRGVPVGKVVKQKVVICPHCNKAGGHKTMPRWHFENCKYK